MRPSKIDIEQFDEKINFNMWMKKMKVVLVYQKYVNTLGCEKVLPYDMLDFEKAKVLETTYSLLILHLYDNMFKKVDEENTTTKLCLTLESLYIIKSLTNKIYLKE